MVKTNESKNEQKTIEDLQTKVSSLEEKNQKLSELLEIIKKEKAELREKELSAYEIFVRAREELIKYIKIWGSILGIIVGVILFFGYNNYTSILNDFKGKVEKELREKIDKSIEKSAKTAIEKSQTINFLRDEFDEKTQETTHKYDQNFIIQRKAINKNIDEISALKLEIEDLKKINNDLTLKIANLEKSINSANNQPSQGNLSLRN